MLRYSRAGHVFLEVIVLCDHLFVLILLIIHLPFQFLYVLCALSRRFILTRPSLFLLPFRLQEEEFAYPFAHLCCGVGFFGAFILDKIAFTHGHSHGPEVPKEPAPIQAQTRTRSVRAHSL